MFPSPDRRPPRSQHESIVAALGLYADFIHATQAAGFTPDDTWLGVGHIQWQAGASTNLIAVDEELSDALVNEDYPKAEELLLAGANINARDEIGTSLLDRVIIFAGRAGNAADVVRFMLKHGADPTICCSEGSGPLSSAVIINDVEVLRLLLDHGADPNRENDLGEALYDSAEFDYRFDCYDSSYSLPEEPSEADQASEEAWLRFLDRIAIKHGKQRPDCLQLLRERGALTGREQRELRG